MSNQFVLNNNSTLYQDNNNLKSYYDDLEKSLDIYKLENEELMIKLHNYNEILKENKNLTEENTKLILNNEILEKQLALSNNHIADLTTKINFIEIEKDELSNLIENFKEKQELEAIKYEKLKKTIKEKDLKISQLNNQLNDIQKEANYILTKTYTNKVSFNSTNFASLYQTASTLYASDNNLNINSNDIKEPLNYGTNLCNVLNDSDEDNEASLNISLTPNNIVEKMSLINIDSKDKNDKKEVAVKQDIYKDFFLLTFHALKLNAKNEFSMQVFDQTQPETIYEKIKEQAVPFHQVKFIIN